MDKQIVVCFPGGAGGHLVAAIVNYLLTKNQFDIDDNGSVHKFHCVKFLEGKLLDNSLESFVQEYVDIQRLPAVGLCIGHFRNISSLVHYGKTVIYLDIDQEDIGEIAKRLSVKMSTMINRNTYDTLKGQDWPAYDQLSNRELTDLAQLRLDFIKKWYYTIPVDKSQVFAVKFKGLVEIAWVDKLSQFLSVQQYDKSYVESMLNKYKAMQ